MALDTTLSRSLGLTWPIFQAPMAGATTVDLVVAVCEAGGLGALGCALMSTTEIASDVASIRARTPGAFHLNFFCHEPHDADDDAWRARLAPYYDALGVDRGARPPVATRAPFDDAACDVVVAAKPAVVSFHFGLPRAALVDRVKRAGCLVVSSATTVEEARWLEGHGCDAIIAQGYEAGGHRGMFLARDVGAQVGTMALVPQVVDAVRAPVIAAGGIADGRGVAAALALGASAVQVGTAYLACPEARVSPLHRAALARVRDDETALTNVFTGRPARAIVNRAVREIGPLAPDAPPFPLAAAAMAPLRAAAEARGSDDFTTMWAGQAARLARIEGAAGLTRRLGEEARATLARLGV